MNLGYGQHYGLMAAEAEALLPGIVREFIHPGKYDTSGNVIAAELKYKAIDYIELIPIMIKGIKEQQNQINILQQQIDSLIAALAITPKVVDPNGAEPTKGSIELENINRIILEQNDPNPFGSRTVIKYDIPEEVTNASIVFVNPMGDVINTYVIKHSGKGELEVFGSKINNGLYTYSLVVDGKIIESKKMVKAQ